MSQNWSDLTGTLVYSGAPIVTPVIKGLFGTLALSAAGEPLTEIQMVTEDVCPSWEEVMESLVTELGLDDDLGDQDQVQEGLVAAVRERFGDKAAALLDEVLTKGLASSLNADVQDLCELALLMGDGHNLKGITAQGAWGGSRVVVGVFGGWAQYESENVSLVMNTERLCEIAAQMDASVADGATAETPAGAGMSLDGVTGGFVKDAAKRARFRKQLSAWLMLKAEEDEAAVAVASTGAGEG